MYSISLLNVYCQKLKINFPIYETINKFGEDHYPTFEVKCIFKNTFEIGEGPTIKLAKEEAAKKVLKTFDIENELLKLNEVSYIIESYNIPLSDIWDNKIDECILTLRKKNKNNNEIKNFKVKILHVLKENE